MAHKDYTFTLTRWHHVAGRIKALSNSQLAEAREVLSGKNIESTLNSEQIDALKARGERALSLLHTGLAGLQVVGQIRRQLAEANGKYGVTALLAEAEEKRSRAKALESFSHIDLLSLTSVDHANASLAARSGDKGLALMRGLRVSLVAPNALDFINDERRSLEAQAAAINDQAAELNRQTFTLSMDETLAKAVGL